MTQVRIFTDINLYILEGAINKFLKEKAVNVVNITFQRDNGHYYAMVIYEEKGVTL